VSTLGVEKDGSPEFDWEASNVRRASMSDYIVRKISELSKWDMLGWLLLGGFVGGAATGLYWTYSTPTVREGTTEVYSPEVTILPEVVIEVSRRR
jgi:hypothetical protein